MSNVYAMPATASQPFRHPRCPHPDGHSSPSSNISFASRPSNGTGVFAPTGVIDSGGSPQNQLPTHPGDETPVAGGVGVVPSALPLLTLSARREWRRWTGDGGPDPAAAEAESEAARAWPRGEAERR